MARTIATPPEYDETAFLLCRTYARTQNTAFNLGIRFMANEMQAPLFAIYAFTRSVSEIVNNLGGPGRRNTLMEYKQATHKAVNDRFSLNSVLHAFQLVVHIYGITPDLVDAYFKSMEMDLTRKRYSTPEYQEYVFGSAEAVGLMCLRVFCHGDTVTFRRLSASARKMGAAIQKTSFLRDYQLNYERHGRVYFPRFEFDSLTTVSQARILAEIDRDMAVAEAGIIDLPPEARRGVYLTYRYYDRLIYQLKQTPAEVIKVSGVHISDWTKLRLAIMVALQSLMKRL